jgi:hypothetical protein
VIFLRIVCDSGRDRDDEGEKACNAEQVEGEFGGIYSEAAQAGWRDKVCLQARHGTVGSRQRPCWIGGRVQRTGEFNNNMVWADLKRFEEVLAVENERRCLSGPLRTLDVVLFELWQPCGLTAFLDTFCAFVILLSRQ